MVVINTTNTPDKPKCFPIINSVAVRGFGTNIKTVFFSISLLINPVPTKIATIAPKKLIAPIPKSKNIF